MNYILETTSIINNVNETKRVQHRPGPCYRFSCVNRSRTHSVTERLPTIRSLNSFSHSFLDMRLCYTLIGALVVAQLLAVDSATFLPCMVVLDNDTRQIIGRTGTVDHGRRRATTAQQHVLILPRGQLTASQGAVKGMIKRP
jgi:hypothetical protein